MNKLNIILTSVLLFLIGIHLGWYLRGVGMDKMIDEEAHRRLTSFVTGGVQRGLITINVNEMDDAACTNSPPVEEASTNSSPEPSQ